jgi:hypothetical protein
MSNVVRFQLRSDLAAMPLPKTPESCGNAVELTLEARGRLSPHLSALVEQLDEVVGSQDQILALFPLSADKQAIESMIANARILIAALAQKVGVERDPLGRGR